jgi:hypothetical protein
MNQGLSAISLKTTTMIGQLFDNFDYKQSLFFYNLKIYQSEKTAIMSWFFGTGK